MTTKAHVDFDFAAMGVRVAIVREFGEYHEVYQWPADQVFRSFNRREPAAEPGDGDWLRLREDDARALYEALADHFGHAGHDARALRRDYEAERKRVDLLIDRLTTTAAPAASPARAGGGG